MDTPLTRTDETVYFVPIDYSDYITTPNRPLRLLSLDGGGVRGLSTLRILKNIMEKLNPDNPPKPCEVFDLIGGTSTGGLLAIMLGRLEMDIESCIMAYLRLSRDIFGKPKKSGILKSLNNKWNMIERFDSKKLEECVKQVVQSETHDEETKMKQENEPRCRSFVCALSTLITKPVCIRSYRPRDLDAVVPDCTIWEAARATSAASTFFNSIKIGDYGEEFSDGAVTENNPVNLVMREAEDIWPDARNRIQCLLSIGTGNPGLRPFGGNLLQVGETLVRIATQTESTANLFANSHPDLKAGRYFRFNVTDGLQNVGLEEHDQIGLIAAATSNYLNQNEIRTNLRGCTEQLKVNLTYPATAFRDANVPVNTASAPPREEDRSRCELFRLPPGNNGAFGDSFWACHSPHYSRLTVSTNNLPIGRYTLHWSVAASCFTLPSNLEVLLRCEKVPATLSRNLSPPQLASDPVSVEKINSNTLASFSGKWLTITSDQPFAIERHDEQLFFSFEVGPEFAGHEGTGVPWNGLVCFSGMRLTSA